MDQFEKLGKKKQISPRDLEKMIESGLLEEESEEVKVSDLSSEDIVEQTKLQTKYTLQELPSNYAPPTLEEEKEPIVIDKRIIYGTAVVCVLAIIIALILSYLNSSSNEHKSECDLQLIMGTNVKRNLTGGDWATLSLPADLAIKDLIKTDSDRRNVIALPDGSTLRLDRNTTIKINSVKSGKKEKALNVSITLYKGSVFIDEMGSSEIIVETKYAIFTPIGTRYYVSQMERTNLTEESIVNVIEGSISMSHIDDPDSKIVVTAGNQASATSQSLVKPKESKSNNWILWNAKWRDIRSIPSLSSTKSLSPSTPVAPPVPMGSASPSFSPQRHEDTPPTNSNPPKAENPKANQKPQILENDPTISNPPPQHNWANSEEERLDKERAAEAARLEEIRQHEEQRRYQESLENRSKNNNNKKNQKQENDNVEIDQYDLFQQQQNIMRRSNFDVTGDSSNRGNINKASSLIAPPMPNIKTGIIKQDPQQNNNGFAPPSNGPRVNNPGAVAPNGGSHGMMMPVGNSSSMEAKVGDSSSMDAKIGDSSSMDAKGGFSL